MDHCFCLMLMVENLLGLKSKHADVTAAFLNAILGDNEKFYVELPIGFKQFGSKGKFKVLYLKKNSQWLPLKSIYLLEISY